MSKTVGSDGARESCLPRGDQPVHLCRRNGYPQKCTRYNFNVVESKYHLYVARCIHYNNGCQ